ncbi:MAG TPA: SLBB domain-containing protein [bacterium]|nr:SLBB domain-containing protein [bacterium]
MGPAYLISQAHRVRGVTALVLALALTLSTATTPTRAQAPDYLIRPGDVLDVLVIGEPDLTRQVTVTPDGDIFLPLVGNVAVGKLTVGQIEVKLATVLSKFVKSPKVMVTYERTGTTGQFVYVLGQVARPGAYDFHQGTTVSELLATAGGPNPQAALAKALILHRTAANPVDLQRLLNGDTSQNAPLQVGDVLVVPDYSTRVLVLGQVQKPGYVTLKEGEDHILDVVVQAGGPTLKAAPERIRILRNGQPVSTDLETFLREGKPELNPVVQPGDIVVMPETDRRIIVLGAVVKPGPIDMGETFPRRVMDAIAAAGGPANLSKLTTVYVIRQNGTEQPTAITVDVWKYLHEGGANQNIELKPGDVVFVPQSPLQTLQTVVGILSGLNLIRVLLGLPCSGC